MPCRLRILSFALLLTVASEGCAPEPPGPGPDPSPGGAGGSAGRGGGGGAGGSGGGQGGASGSGGGEALDAATPDSGSPAPDGGPAPDFGAAVGGGDTGPAGGRISMAPAIAARWMGERRSIKMEDGVMVFTGVFEPGRVGGPSGHNIRFPLPAAKDTLLEYRIRFDGNYDYGRGGKIPGLGGGTAPTGCVDTNGSGFSARMMWRENGRLIGYLYDNNQSSDCGRAIEAGFNFKRDQWHAVKQRVKVNTGTAANGILQVWVDERMVINRSNISYMNNGQVDQLLFHSFYGGSSTDWAPSRQTSISFSEVYVTPTLP
jgi:hypothetical protein